MRTHIVLWKWAKPEQHELHREYSSDHVNIMVEMIKRAMVNPPRILCITDDATGITGCETYPLWKDCWNIPNATKAALPSCYRRLKLYDPATQLALGIDKGDRIVGLDLDTIIIGDLQSVLATEGRFVGWRLVGERNKQVYNGSFQMFTAGDHSEIWSAFDPIKSPNEANSAGYNGSDQAWLSWKLVGAPGSTSIAFPSFASYPLHCIRLGALSRQTKLVFFHGRQKPWVKAVQDQSSWIKRYWRL